MQNKFPIGTPVIVRHIDGVCTDLWGKTGVVQRHQPTPAVENIVVRMDDAAMPCTHFSPKSLQILGKFKFGVGEWVRIKSNHGEYCNFTASIIGRNRQGTKRIYRLCLTPYIGLDGTIDIEEQFLQPSSISRRFIPEFLQGEPVLINSKQPYTSVIIREARHSSGPHRHYYVSREDGSIRYVNPTQLTSLFKSGTKVTIHPNDDGVIEKIDRYRGRKPFLVQINSEESIWCGPKEISLQESIHHHLDDLEDTNKQIDNTAEPERLTMKSLIPNPHPKDSDNQRVLVGTGHHFSSIERTHLCFDWDPDNGGKLLGYGDMFYENEVWDKSIAMFLPNNLGSRAFKMSVEDLREVERRIYEQFPPREDNKGHCIRCLDKPIPESRYCYKHHKMKKMEDARDLLVQREEEARRAAEEEELARRKEEEKRIKALNAPKWRRRRRMVYAALLVAGLAHTMVDFNTGEVRGWTKRTVQTVGIFLKDLGQEK